MQDYDEELCRLNRRINYLEALLREHNIAYDPLEAETPSQPVCILKEILTQEHVRFYYSMFKGRRDVYSKRAGKPNPKSGKVGYYTQCENFWKQELCAKRERSSVKCSECSHRQFKPLMGGDLMRHLQGLREDCSDVIGVYPMFPDGCCHFLVFDFDNHDAETLANNDWCEEVNALREICSVNRVPALVERSRSGNGAHVWLFFEEAIPAALARRFGTTLLTQGAQSVNMKSFRSYDRMIPAQDHLPEGGLGNLVALPLQGRALKDGHSAFIDGNWQPFPDQWRTLREIRKIPKSFVQEKTALWAEAGLLGELASHKTEDESHSAPELIEQPWKQVNPTWVASDAGSEVIITLAHQIFIDTRPLKPRLQNQIRRLAAFSNQKYYKNRAMGFSTQGVARIISCSRDEGHYICLPRGCAENLRARLDEAAILYSIRDERQYGMPLKVSFTGTLYPEQQLAADAMLSHETGILAAATAFGKTAVGAFLVAARQVNTLVLVHNTEIMKNWVEDFEKFLHIDHEAPEYRTASGRIRKRKKPIGRLISNHNSLTGIIDIAMISSLGKKGDIKPLVKDYGLVIMDECHHAASVTAEEVLNEVSARYVYGLSATPQRDDGQEAKVLMLLGGVRHRYTAKEKAKAQGIAHFVFPRFTRLTHALADDLKINEAYRLVRESKLRNDQIVHDVRECLSHGRTPLVMSKFKEHAALLHEKLKQHCDHIFLLQGGRSSKERDRIREQMKAVPAHESIIIVAIGQYIGEGFNYPRLDTMMLTTPIAWTGNVEQYAGRLHRDYEGKQDVIIYDYVDSHIPVLERMYHKRLRSYKRIGYQICSSLMDKTPTSNSIYDKDNYAPIYERDLLEAQRELIIASPGINAKKVHQLLDLVSQHRHRALSVVILTLAADQYPPTRITATLELHQRLRALGITVKELPQLHEHYALIDQEIVWYGSMNLLSREREDDNIIRLRSKEIAQELMERSFHC